MIDLFWTKRRIQKLCKCELSLAEKWIDDYAGWIYGRAWYCLSGNQGECEKVLHEVFTISAIEITKTTGSDNCLSKKLLDVFGRVVSSGFQIPAEIENKSLIQDMVCLITSRELNENAAFWRQLVSLSQSCLAMLDRDEQEVLIARYLKLETPAEISSRYNLDIAYIQDLLYRARHSFRRFLESILQISSDQTSKNIPSDLSLLESNFEKLFRSMEPRPSPPEDFLNLLKKEAIQIFAEHGNVSSVPDPKIKVLIISVVVLVVFLVLYLIFRNPKTSNMSPGSSVTPAPKHTAKEIKTAQPGKEVNEQDAKKAFDYGEQKDVEGLMRIMRTDSYAAQIVAAHYLEKYGDRSAIDLLDKAGRKWYNENPAEENPFFKAITSIENRIKQQALEEQARQEKLRQEQLVQEQAQQEKQRQDLMRRLEELKKQIEEKKKQSSEPNLPQKEQPADPNTIEKSEDPNEPAKAEPETKLPAEKNDPNVKFDLKPVPYSLD